MRHLTLLTLAPVCLASCYLSHERERDASLADAVVIDAAVVPTCEHLSSSGVAAPVPMLWYPFDGDFENHGSAAGGNGTLLGTSTDVPGPFASAVSLPNRSAIYMAGTAAILEEPAGLTFSVWVRYDAGSTGRSAIACRSTGGFETYTGVGGVRAGLVTCIGDGYGPPLAWGACGTVPASSSGWTHFVLRWAGIGSEPEVTTDGLTWLTLAAIDDFPLDPSFDTFDAPADLSVGSGAGDGSLARGSMTVDDLRVYDVALPRETAWATTSCSL